MGKVICEICGTSYPETAEQCPICGNVRSADSVVADDGQEGNTARESGYTYVKGGRFSKANVKKRNKALQKGMPADLSRKAAKTSQKPEKTPDKKPGGSSEKGLTIAVIVLLVLVLAVALFIVFKFFVPFPGRSDQDQATAPVVTTVPATEVTETTTVPVTEMTTAPTEASFACKSLKISDQRIELDAEGRAWLLEVTTDPADTTDQIIFKSSDERVATVSNQGRVTAVGAGQAAITVTCGTQTAECRVVCTFGEQEITEATEEPQGGDEPAGDELEISHTDVTLVSAGESFDIVAKGVDSSEINWSVNNSAVATVSNGTVTAVGDGMTTVIAEYNGMRAECIVRCNFS